MLASLVDEWIGDKTSWIVDVGCGTGLVGYHLGRRGFRHVDGVDLVQEMLDQAAAKDCYTRLVRGNLLERIPINENRYDVAVSAGTFTHRHVGPDGLDEVVRVVRPGGKALILCNGEAYAADGYEAKIEDLKRLGLVDVTESSDVGTILDNGIRGQLLVLDIHI